MREARASLPATWKDLDIFKKLGTVLRDCFGRTHSIQTDSVTRPLDLLSICLVSEDVVLALRLDDVEPHPQRTHTGI